MKKLLLIGILISNISYGASTRQIPVSSKCYDIDPHFYATHFEYCEMSNGDVCYANRAGISCFKN